MRGHPFSRVGSFENTPALGQGGVKEAKDSPGCMVKPMILGRFTRSGEQEKPTPPPVCWPETPGNRAALSVRRPGVGCAQHLCDQKSRLRGRGRVSCLGAGDK